MHHSLLKDLNTQQPSVMKKATKHQHSSDRSHGTLKQQQPSTRHVTFAFAIILFGTMLGGLTQTQMNTVLPYCMDELGIGVGQAQWLVNIYLLVLGIVIPVYAFLDRTYAKRTLFNVALVLFALGSICIVVAPSFALMIVGRVLQGCAAGILFPLSQTFALTKFPPEKHAMMMGFLGLAMGFAPNIGPTLAGACAQAWGWRSSFYLLLIICAVCFVLSLLYIKKDTPSASVSSVLDIASLVYSTIGFGGILAGISNISTYGIADAHCIVPCVVGIVALAAFIHRENSIKNPILYLSVFKDTNFTMGTIMICALFCAFIGVTLLIPLYVQEVLGDTALQSAIVLFPGVISALIINPLSGWLMGKVGPRPIVCTASVLLVVGTLQLLYIGNMTDLLSMAMWQAIRSFGISGLIMPLTTWSLGHLGPRTPDGTSISNAFRQIASAIGTALIVLLSEEGIPGGLVTSNGTNAAMAFSLAMSLVVAVLSFVCVDRKKAPKA